MRETESRETFGQVTYRTFTQAINDPPRYGRGRVGPDGSVVDLEAQSVDLR